MSEPECHTEPITDERNNRTHDVRHPGWPRGSPGQASGGPKPSQHADRVRSDKKRIDQAIEYLATRLEAPSGEWPVFGESQVYILLGAIRGARVAIGEIDAATMATRIDDSAHAESHAWPITNRFDTPLKPTANP